MKILNGKGQVLGRLASYTAKELLHGEEIAIVNCEKIIITGNKAFIKSEIDRKRNMVGTSQRGPKHPATSEILVKRTVRGMLPNHREGRGKEVYAKLKCYVGVPRMFEGKQIIEFPKPQKLKISEVKEYTFK
jgi:large subunit ribosomal protein L13